ncbi:hypothetical protein E4V01_20430 [Methylorubrum sp. Q1]|uniref:hypothetical protein n=1 Tax=Methylorubrum sp. Q1 TaxID=2562453 RepID=UPI001075CEC3|nr:hypothetical protein [Methylorubrum sp. Q1]TFZ56071.1 hypothetical protein E4V01_20430 [Methylorubrum sp. Q1]
MDCQSTQLAGAPFGSPVGPEAYVCRFDDSGAGRKNIAIVATILDAFASVLTAEEALLGAALHGPAGSIREAVEVIRSVAREAIETAIAAPGDALERIALLGHAVDFEGANGPLVGQIALTLAAGAVPTTVT